jgi:hypothetical protein
MSLLSLRADARGLALGSILAATAALSAAAPPAMAQRPPEAPPPTPTMSETIERWAVSCHRDEITLATHCMIGGDIPLEPARSGTARVQFEASPGPQWLRLFVSLPARADRMGIRFGDMPGAESGCTARRCEFQGQDVERLAEAVLSGTRVAYLLAHRGAEQRWYRMDLGNLNRAFACARSFIARTEARPAGGGDTALRCEPQS